MAINSEQVGVVKEIFRYPVKSMRGQSLSEVEVRWNGLVADRRYALVQSDNRTGFPWLTGREVASMLRYEPYFAEPNDPAKSPVRVKTPEGQDLPIEGEELQAELSALWRGPIHLMQSDRGNYDSATFSLISAATIRSLGERIDQELDPRRFRPNILLETESGRPFEEEEWLGRLLLFGEDGEGARVRLNRRDKRCMMINLDPDTTRQTPAVLREVVQNRQEYLGMYGQVEAVGIIRVGDRVRIRTEE